jgi:hypothetical protein
MSVAPILGWPVESGASWVQTRETRLARKLYRRTDTRLIGIRALGRPNHIEIVGEILTIRQDRRRQSREGRGFAAN